MPDFESGAFNRALPPLRFVYNDLRDAPRILFLPVAVLWHFATLERLHCCPLNVKMGIPLGSSVLSVSQEFSDRVEIYATMTSLLAELLRWQCHP